MRTKNKPKRLSVIQKKRFIIDILKRLTDLVCLHGNPEWTEVKVSRELIAKLEKEVR